MPDYENDLAFKPAMTWEELCEWVKKFKELTCITWQYIEFNNSLMFYEDGGIYQITGNPEYDTTIAINRTPEQMKNIIDNLYGED